MTTSTRPDVHTSPLLSQTPGGDAERVKAERVQTGPRHRGVRALRSSARLLALVFVLGGGTPDDRSSRATPSWATPSRATPTPAAFKGFTPGETLRYSGDFGVFGRVGRGELSVSPLECVRNRLVHRIAFSFEGRVMLMSIRDHTQSWVLPGSLTSIRYHKEERHPLGTRIERVDIDPESRSWANEGGAAGAFSTPTPMDELSFLFLARSLDLELGEVLEFDLHFDPARSPVRIRDRGRERIRVPAGEFDTRVVEMEVKDDSRFGETGRVVLHLTDDAARIPVRIASAMPVVGSLVLVLEDRQLTAPSPRSTPVGGPC